MRLGDFVGRSFCACARPRRSTPSNPAASFLHIQRKTHPSPWYRLPTQVFPPSHPPAVPLRRHCDYTVLYYIHSSAVPLNNISSSFRSKNPSSSSSSSPDVTYRPLSLVIRQPVPNPLHRSIIYHALSSPRRLYPATPAWSSPENAAICLEARGRLRLTRLHNAAVALFLPETNGCY